MEQQTAELESNNQSKKEAVTEPVYPKKVDPIAEKKKHIKKLMLAKKRKEAAVSYKRKQVQKASRRHNRG